MLEDKQAITAAVMTATESMVQATRQIVMENVGEISLRYVEVAGETRYGLKNTQVIF